MSSFPLHNLPNELTHEILGYIDLKSVIRVSLVNRDLNSLIDKSTDFIPSPIQKQREFIDDAKKELASGSLFERFVYQVEFGTGFFHKIANFIHSLFLKILGDKYKYQENLSKYKKACSEYNSTCPRYIKKFNAINNTTNPYEFFPASEKLIKIAKHTVTDRDSWRSRCKIIVTERNQTILSYTLYQGEKGHIVTTPKSAMNSRGYYCLIFVIEFDEQNSLIKLVNKPERGWGDLTEQERIDFTVEIFNVLKNSDESKFHY